MTTYGRGPVPCLDEVRRPAVLFSEPDCRRSMLGHLQKSKQLLQVSHHNPQKINGQKQVLGLDSDSDVVEETVDETERIE